MSKYKKGNKHARTPSETNHVTVTRGRDMTGQDLGSRIYFQQCGGGRRVIRKKIGGD